MDEIVAGGDPAFGFEACWRAVQPDDVLTLIYTSGTTGPPKGVEITHAQMLANCTAAASVWPEPGGPADRVISYLPMAHIAERYGSHYLPMITGEQVTPLADAKALLGALTDVRPTIFGGVPRVWEKLKAGIETMVTYEPDQARRQAVLDAFGVGLEYVDATLAGEVPTGLAEAYQRADEQILSQIRLLVGLDQVRVAISGAAPIAPEILKFMLALGLPVAEVWGMSECSCIGTAKHGITDPAPAILAGHPAIRAAISAAVDAANGRLSRVEQIKRFAIVPAFWEPGGDEITPTMKLKRRAITAKYAHVIDSLYTAASEPA